jgi:hypothetical protein
MSPRTLRDWDEAKTVLSGLDAHVFRGLRDPKWKLESLFEREPWVKQFRGHGKPIQCSFNNDGYEVNRDDYLARFCETDPMRTESKVAKDDELWALGRHFGLITPLLDWTRNWRVAAFFALSDWVGWIHRFEGGDDPDTDTLKKRKEENPSACVWVLAREPSPFTEGEFRLIEAAPKSERFRKRQEAQGGIYTQILTGEHFDVEAYLQESGNIQNLCQYSIPGCCAKRALKELHDAEIDYAHLFPDPEGWAKHSNVLSRLCGFGEGLNAKTERVKQFRTRSNH